MQKIVKFLVIAAVLLVLNGGATLITAQDTEPLVINIGIQRGNLWGVPELHDGLVKALEEGLGKPVDVELTLFPAGPPLLEALNAGSIDFGGTGDTPPIFAQAAGTPLVYVASQLSSSGQALIVPENSPVQSVADLKGKTIAYTKGSSANFFTIQALQSVGLEITDVESAFLNPADARAAFDGGSIDAWTIWDPFLTTAKTQVNARVLFAANDLPAPQRSYQLASQKFVTEQPEALQIILDQVQAQIDWSRDNPDDWAAFLESETTIPADVWLAIRAENEVYDLDYITDEIVEQQQGVADVFYDLQLIPEKLDISSVVWAPAEAAQATEEVQATEQVQATEEAGK
ncbi:MAG TPA: aliphatic sulfonate ABC transporter substrate-binding protein [Phototrophicaceae bacterium]|jgi:sulfonate transport system substrate-binding protein|nr:aliphatic sulfonate ABC transporter substrate-binding protein [Phototrophicaceae bacterium]